VASIKDELWTAVDQYIGETVVPTDAALEAAVESTGAAGLPLIQVSAAQGKLLHVLARMQRARAILEIGTLGGYSTIWLARALPDAGCVVTIELDPRHADVARANVERAGLSSRVDFRVGPALDVLPQLAGERAGPFDLVFIDADKANIPAYFEWAMHLSRPGAVIVVDNVIRDGKLIEPGTGDPAVEGVRRLHDVVASDPRVTATTIQTVGSKGYDGFTLIFVNRARD
jgi:predicted O-methyltransferase YrrM